MSDRAHQGLVAIFEVAVKHVVVALVDRQINWLADGATRMMNSRRHVGEFDEIFKIFDGRVASAFIEVMDKGRAIGGHQHGSLTANGHITSGVSRMLHILAWRTRLNDLPAHACWKADPRPVDLCTGFPK